jgi:hypothetical protein
VLQTQLPQRRESTLLRRKYRLLFARRRLVTLQRKAPSVDGSSGFSITEILDHVTLFIRGAKHRQNLDQSALSLRLQLFGQRVHQQNKQASKFTKTLAYVSTQDQSVAF